MNVIDSTTLYLFIISLLFCLKYAVELVINLRQDEPEQIKLDFTRKFYLLLSTSYVITYIINLF